MNVPMEIWEDEYRTLKSFVKLLEKPEGLKMELLAEAAERELTPRQKQVVHLYYIGELTMPEIGRKLGVNKSTVSRTLSLARDKLKVLLSFAVAR